ncbi:DNA invertase Pin-like site-specific DNA recombinase [Leucobacter exalbidus]|uniref:DNA invertase Pin-like site-specific DNA recombinase n=1 Tax=Leucobacter exalbidus TaxID=662960 RepID=A0A940PP97_9MICO|nr:recombinase family protein [Leucobacter exalbidus]MBP1325084.1 DNA invertase Pin-like site-specific DNA recombinase [Leucobacter exalbidus]
MDSAGQTVREYLRVSSDRSGTGKSPGQQHEEMVATAKQKGWLVHSRPYEDTDRSASRYTKKVREGFTDLLDDLEAGNFGADILGLWESSRGSRRTGEWIDLIELCAKQGVGIWVLTHGRVYDPTNARDRRSLREDASDAEYESDKTSERLLRDVRANAMKGRPHGKNLYGYERLYDKHTRDLLEVIEHPDQGPVVREAARRVLAGETYYAIARDFNVQGIPARRPKFNPQREVMGWTAPAVKQMLTMPAYAGLRQHQGEVLEDVDTIWPTLIDRDSWHKLQAVMAGRSKLKGNHWETKYLLTGIAVCGECGNNTRTGKQNAGRRQYDKVTGEKLPLATYKIYTCLGTPGKKGFHVAMRLEFLDELVTEVVLARIKRPDFLAQIGQADQGVDTVRAELLQEIEGHRKWLEEVHQLAMETKNLTMLSQQEQQVRPLIDAAQKKLESLAQTDPLVIKLAGADDIDASWQEMSVMDQRQVIRLLVVPKINRMPDSRKGRKGIYPDRVDFAWR